MKVHEKQVPYYCCFVEGECLRILLNHHLAEYFTFSRQLKQIQPASVEISRRSGFSVRVPFVAAHQYPFTTVPHVKYRSSVKFVRATLKHVTMYIFPKSVQISSNFHVLTLAGSIKIHPLLGRMKSKNCIVLGEILPFRKISMIYTFCLICS